MFIIVMGFRSSVRTSVHRPLFPIYGLFSLNIRINGIGNAYFGKSLTFIALYIFLFNDLRMSQSLPFVYIVMILCMCA